jgi:aspartyl-tRNA(Asn)/glutamyl-tRNA(Gln) amidotransferase subunit A
VADLTRLGVEELLDEFRRRRTSPADVVEALAARIEAVDPKVGAFTTLCLDRARREALHAEDAWRGGSARPLEGIPFGVKDLFDSEGVRTTYGSPMFADHVPVADAEPVRRARAAGAILIGKTQTHEFAWGISSVNELMGSTHNPWALDRISGGSSGGSAVALAADELPLALGSDTGGSIRVPSSLCGVVGLKPTYGRVSLAGAWPLARTLDHPGPMARSPAAAGLLLVAIAGVDDADPSTEDVSLGDVAGELRRGFAGLTVGLCPDLHLVEPSPDVRVAYEASVRAVEHGGARIVEVPLPEAKLMYPTFGVIQRAEALDTHRRAGLFPARRSEYGADVLGRLELAGEVSTEQYLGAAADRQRARAGFRRVFRDCDLLLTPVAGGPPFPELQEAGDHLGREISFRDLVMPYTTPQDLCGLPACALRAGFDGEGIPVGMQFTGPPWSEARVLRAAQALYEATPEIQRRRPTL